MKFVIISFLLFSMLSITYAAKGVLTHQDDAFNSNDDSFLANLTEEEIIEKIREISGEIEPKKEANEYNTKAATDDDDDEDLDDIVESQELSDTELELINNILEAERQGLDKQIETPADLNQNEIEDTEEYNYNDNASKGVMEGKYEVLEINQESFTKRCYLVL